jgi:L-ascorbate metabolism protein UlaG (beta-lactamase superfamily)
VLTRAKSAADHDEDLGCSILGPASRPVRRAHALLKQKIQRLGAEGAAREAKQLIRWLEQTPEYGALCEGTRRSKGRRLLRAEILYPDVTGTPPRFLHLRRDELGLDLPVRTGEWPLLNELFATLAQGASAAELRTFKRVPLTAALLADLRAAKWLEPATTPDVSQDGVFVGHNTTLLRGKLASVLVDPYFRPASLLDLPTYQPLQPRDLGRVDGVVITHSHGDHFHLGSLLQLPRDTRFFVPPVERENLFSTDCAARLRQLGFTQVEALPWSASRTVGDVTVTALPFYGEQPTSEPGVQGLVNVGSTWHLKSPRGSAAFFADSGADHRGDMTDVCASVKGGVDALFCGVRGFRLKPIFFGFTTLDAFLVDVPLALLTSPQQLMADADTALDYAKRLEAKTLVPCADGGAPWYWREGMGPRYPGFPGVPLPGASQWDENPDADPFPERVVARGGAQRRKVSLLRPGAHFRLHGGLTETASNWPFDALQQRDLA